MSRTKKRHVDRNVCMALLVMVAAVTYLYSVGPTITDDMSYHVLFVAIGTGFLTGLSYLVTSTQRAKFRQQWDAQPLAQRKAIPVLTLILFGLAGVFMLFIAKDLDDPRSHLRGAPGVLLFAIRRSGTDLAVAKMSLYSGVLSWLIAAVTILAFYMNQPGSASREDGRQS